MTSEAVRQAAAAPDLNHREPAFRALVTELRSRLLGVYSGFEEWIPYIVGGSGTAAVEAAVTSCVNTGPVLVLENGYYSERVASMFEVHEIAHENLDFDWMHGYDLDRIEAKLRGGAFECVFALQNETTTGRLNPISKLGKLCHRYGARLIVDAISGFGADPLEPDSVDVVIGSANKCLHGLPGVSFVLCRPDLGEQMRGFKRRTYYLSLPMMESEVPALTPPIPAMSALRQALREMGEGGARCRHDRYLRQQKRLFGAMQALGMEPLIPIEEASCTMITAAAPAGWSADRWLERNYEAGFVLYGCKGPLRDSNFQVSVMGEVTDLQLEAWLQCAERLIAEGP